MHHNRSAAAAVAAAADVDVAAAADALAAIRNYDHFDDGRDDNAEKPKASPLYYAQ